MVYRLEFPYISSLDRIDITSIFNLNEWYFERPVEENRDKNGITYDLDYGEHLILHLKCDETQCYFDVKVIGVYENSKRQPYLVEGEEYRTTFNRSSVADIASTQYAPVVLRNFFKYLRPYDVPEYWYEPKDVCQIVEQIKKFFDEYFSVRD
jgi:hypothetical protein